MDTLLSLQNRTDELAVEYEIVSTDGSNADLRTEIACGLSDVEAKIERNDRRLDKLDDEIDRLTSDADSIDYTVSVTCGLLTGIIDSVFVGEWDFSAAKAVSNKEINQIVISFAKKHPDYDDFIARKKIYKDPNRLASAIEFLEDKYPLPGDSEFSRFDEQGVVASSHHLDDFCHHPTLVGLVCSILVQFTGTARYTSSAGERFITAVAVNDYGMFVSNAPWGKVFSGIVNWFFTAGKTAKNFFSHLISDMAGSRKSAKAGNPGTGLPGPILSTLKELADIPCFNSKNLHEQLRMAYQNGIGSQETQVDLGAFNALFEGASSDFDLRTENAVRHELKRQAFPVMMNEMLVRGFYFVRRLIEQLKSGRTLLELDWKAMLPIRHRTIVRMMTIASGTLTAVDLADAAIRSAVKSGGAAPEFAKNFILRVNFVGVGRFSVACVTDMAMGIKRELTRGERLAVMGEQLHLLNARTFYKEADMWIEAKNAAASIDEVYQLIEKTSAIFAASLAEREESLARIADTAQALDESNPGLINDILNELS